MIRYVLTSYLALGVALWLLPGVQSSDVGAVALLAIVVIIVGAVLRTLLLAMTIVLGSFGLLLAGVVIQMVILGIALSITPGLESDSTADVVLAAWIATAAGAMINWLFDAGSDDAFLAQVLGRAIRLSAVNGERSGRPGLLIIQLDGVSAPLLRQAVTGGTMPNVSRWLRSGSHELRDWHTGLPATTPAGQAVLLHGDTQHIPSFRWYDKETGKILVANRPGDAAEIEKRISDGRGLLADDGVSVSNLFSGDAPTRLLTMSDARLPSAKHGVAAYAVARSGLARSLVVFAGEVITEWYQGRRQRLRDVQPRVRRGGVFVLLRGVTTVILRDLNVSIVAEQMAHGAPTIYVDFVDYDEVAHHAGPSRPEAVRTLDGLDHVIGLFERIAHEVDRRYEIVLVSDHGQAQGATFRQMSGATLDETVATLVASASSDAREHTPAEPWGPANVLLTGAARSDDIVGGATRGLMRTKVEPTHAPGDVQVDLGRTKQPQATRESPDVVVVVSGSLSHLYLADVPGRVDRVDIERRHPALIEGLARHPYVGAVIVRDGDDLVVLGSDGWRVLVDGATIGGEGVDPLAVYGDRAAGDLLALDQRAHVGDLVLLGRHDPSLGDVAAFEELVGSHGGLGGDQTSALLIHPTEMRVPEGDLSGRDVFEALRARQRTLGLRDDETEDSSR
ncbi:alkaline phosphatase family protein [Nocardioidaceae bacterium SCSIO 66511]|nr:alkaline phosphatase family protein [Nocardioidaceae bacterium SCSIO 66511]